jgi:hypothetical protein
MNGAISLVQTQLEAYNAQDLDAMLACYAPDCVIAGLNGAVGETSRDSLRARYARTFAEFPDNRVRLVNRIQVGDIVIDHEDVNRGPGKDRFEVIAIYTIRNGQIARVDFAK